MNEVLTLPGQKMIRTRFFGKIQKVILKMKMVFEYELEEQHS